MDLFSVIKTRRGGSVLVYQKHLVVSIDIMPGMYCDALDLERGSNYVDGANAILEWYDRKHG